MSEASFASLGPTLLARKGGAKPAMRPQLAPMPEVVAAEQLEDLGWNDMGAESPDDDEAAQGDNIVSLKTSSNPAAANEDDVQTLSKSPLVAREQRDAHEIRTDQVLADAAMEPSEAAQRQNDAVEKIEHAKPAPVPVKRSKSAAAKARAARANARRAAFTLRLDTDRHLKLRLAATMQGTSAQALVTEALDAMLAEIDDLDALVERFNKPPKGQSEPN
ncbi:MAG: hypothetical protein ACX930_06680 [Erythrobacter sp.]